MVQKEPQASPKVISGLRPGTLLLAPQTQAEEMGLTRP